MPIKSMTGFGQGRKELGSVALSVEVKTVNHRFLDIYFKLPSQYLAFEQNLTKLVKEKLTRGRVEIYVSRDEFVASNSEVRFNVKAFESYVNATKKALKAVGVNANDAAYAQILTAGLQRREVLDLVPRKTDVTAEYKLLSQAVAAAINDLMKMRVAEGKALLKEIQRLLQEVSNCLKKIKPLTDVDVKDVQQRVSARIAKLFPDISLDPGRVAAEAAILAEKSDVTEEIARLDSHVKQFKDLLSAENNGRKLEFLLQEMGREINTLGTKAQNSKISVLVIEVKGALEKLREQIANIE